MGRRPATQGTPLGSPSQSVHSVKSAPVPSPKAKVLPNRSPKGGAKAKPKVAAKAAPKEAPKGAPKSPGVEKPAKKPPPPAGHTAEWLKNHTPPKTRTLVRRLIKRPESRDKDLKNQVACISALINSIGTDFEVPQSVQGIAQSLVKQLISDSNSHWLANLYKNGLRYADLASFVKFHELGRVQPPRGSKPTTPLSEVMVESESDEDQTLDDDLLDVEDQSETAGGSKSPPDEESDDSQTKSKSAKASRKRKTASRGKNSNKSSPEKETASQTTIVVFKEKPLAPQQPSKKSKVEDAFGGYILKTEGMERWIPTFEADPAPIGSGSEKKKESVALGNSNSTYSGARTTTTTSSAPPTPTFHMGASISTLPSRRDDVAVRSNTTGRSPISKKK